MISATVGTSGRSGERLASVTASSRSFSFYVLEALRAGGEHELRLTRDRVGNGGCSAPVRHVHHRDLRHLFEQCTAQMVGRASTGRSVGNLSWIRFGVGNEFANIVGRNRRVQHHRIGHVSQQRYRREIVHAIKRHCCKQRVIHGVYAHRIEQERVAVRGRSCHDSCANVARRSRAILDDDRLTERLVQVFGNDARRHVCTTRAFARAKASNQCLRLGATQTWRNTELTKFPLSRTTSMYPGYLSSSSSSSPIWCWA